MVIAILITLGLTLGSFINALVWRLYQQNLPKKKRIATDERLSISKGRSMCMSCGHELGPLDLVPVASWLWLRGRCRYCGARIPDTPFTELVLPMLFLVSYFFWPYSQAGWDVGGVALFGLWLLILTCFLALTVYDAKWYRLPDRIVLPLTIFAAVFVCLRVAVLGDIQSMLWSLGGAAVISGLFWLLSVLSKGTWIGWGDVKLGVPLGLLAGTPLMGALVIFLASVFGTLVVLPGLLMRKRGLKSSLPFGPCLIGATVIVVLWGETLWHWYVSLLTI